MTMSPYIRELRALIGSRIIAAPSAGIVIFDDEGRMLLAKHRKMQVWTTIGGMMEPLEHPADCALRETWEETGVVAEITGFLGVFAGPEGEIVYENGDRVSYTGVMFTGRIVSGAPASDGDENDALGWFAKVDALALPMSAHTRAILTAAEPCPAAPWFKPPSWRPPT